MSNDIPIAIIGGGVIGCAVAWELSKVHQGIFLFEKNPGITAGENQSSRNSGVIHSGIYYDQETRPLKAALCVEGNHMLYEFCSRHQVPALKTGKLLVATSDQEDEVLDAVMPVIGITCAIPETPGHGQTGFFNLTLRILQPLYPPLNDLKRGEIIW